MSAHTRLVPRKAVEAAARILGSNSAAQAALDAAVKSEALGNKVQFFQRGRMLCVWEIAKEVEQ